MKRLVTNRLGALFAALVLLTLSAACSDDENPNDTNGNNDDVTICGSDFDCTVGKFCIRGECEGEMGSECFNASECEGDKMECRQGYCVEEEPECTEDAQCGDGEICEDDVCAEGCRNNGDCEGAEVCTDDLRCEEPPPECPDTCPDHTECDESTGQCESDGTCSDDDDCPTPGEVCEEDVCVEEIVTCQSNNDCDDGLICDLDTELCVPGCRVSGECALDEFCVEGACSTTPPDCEADDSEPNDSFEEAAPITDGTITDRTLCDDEDWYSFSAFATDEVSINVNFVHDDGNINVQLINPDGSVLQLAGSTDDNETIDRSVNVTGQHGIRVVSPNRGTFTTYSIEFSRTRNCAEDAQEENDDANNATVIEGLGADFDGLTICNDDDDWFSIDLYPGESFEATMSFTHTEGDLSLELYEADGTTEITTSATDQDFETVSYTATSVETVLLRVPGVTDLINAYALSVAVTARECTEDDGEEDDTNATARAITLGEAVTGALCLDDSDWFTFVSPADANVTATLDHDNGEGDLTLEIYQADGATLLEASATDADAEVVEFAVPTPGVYYARVVGVGRSQAAYTLTIDSDFDATCPDDDAFEEDDAFDAPATLEAGVHPNRVLCEADAADWIQFDLAEGESFQVYTLAATQHGELELALFGPESADDSTPLAEATGAGEIKRVQQQLGATPGTYKVRVTASMGEEVFYSLRLFIYDGRLPLECPDDDDFEDNDNASGAANLEFDTSEEAIVCGADTDWFQFNVTAGERISLRADFAHAEGNIDLALRDANGLIIQTAASVTDNEYLVFVAPTSGRMYVEAVLSEGEGNVYWIGASAQAGSPGVINCALDDTYEQNDDYASASPIEAGRLYAAHCGTDADFYSIDVPADMVLRLSLTHDGGADALDLRLFDSTEGEVATAAVTGDGTRQLTYNTVVGENLKIAVNASASVEAQYTLNVEIFDELPAACGTDDALEPNATIGDATGVDMAVTHTNLGLCGADEDWFAVTVPEDMQAVVTATFDEELGDLDMEVFDARGAGVTASRGSRGLERVAIPNDDMGDTFYARLYLDGQTEEPLSYDLSVTYELTALPCFEDEFEPNETRADAAMVASAQTYPELGFCEGEDDWYMVNLQMFDFFTVTINFDGSAADLDMELADDLFPMFSEGVGDSEELTSISLFGGPVFFRVYSAGEGTVNYEMITEVGGF